MYLPTRILWPLLLVGVCTIRILCYFYDQFVVEVPVFFEFEIIVALFWSKKLYGGIWFRISMIFESFKNR